MKFDEYGNYINAVFGRNLLNNNLNYFVGGNNTKRPMLMWRSRIVFKLKRFRREWKKLGCKRKFFFLWKKHFQIPNDKCTFYLPSPSNNKNEQSDVSVKRASYTITQTSLHQMNHLHFASTWWDLDFDIYISLIYFPTAHNQRDQPKCKIINQPDWHKLWQE